MEIKKYLEDLEIKYRLYKHPPVYTVEEASKYNGEIKGIHCKNLFVKDRKSRKFYLIIISAEEKLNLKDYEEILEEKLKFANEKDLKEILNLETGAVSPFGLINDKEAKTILIIEKKILESDYVSFHPNINTETLELTRENFQKYLNTLKNKIIIK